jgi:F-type H+-transporting ATPase subunit gamma
VPPTAVPPDRGRGGPGGRRPEAEYLFEPEPEQILDFLLPQYLVTKVYAALLSRRLRERRARRAMKAATDNAEELIRY